MLDTDYIDFLSVSPNGHAVLHIVQQDRWTGTDDQLLTLQAKVNTYLAFVLDGQMAADHPDLADLPWRIALDSRAGAPDTRTAQLLSLLADGVRAHGGDLYEVPK
ncbi:hypothetical protein C8N24_6252 [Solirubrobacter pauli]|uniref:Uncharacterized protein n=1 Tax=Solirubrobacter pauli TaxID=166793 RepID=A0A660L2I7_9ACTN|nr:DUF6572 domain-containing protein [Solirubrobacter pauli]RKQ88211.1 hypothetical protein C8N24_6252 [Solirubrobacter pauli]